MTLQLRLCLIRRVDEHLEVLDDELADEFDALCREDVDGLPFVIQNHLRRSTDATDCYNFWRPAFKIIDGRAEEYTIKFRAELLKFDRSRGLFYFDDPLIGVTAPGTFELIICRQSKPIAVKKLVCLPSSMTKAQRDAMLSDLLYISRDLLAATEASDHLGQVTLQSPTDFHRKYLENVRDTLKNILPSMERISRRPRFELRPQSKLIAHQKLKRFDAKVLRQYVTNRNKYHVEVAARSTDIYEHRLLLRLFNQLKCSIARFNGIFDAQRRELERKIEAAQHEILSTKQQPTWENYVAALEKRFEQLRRDNARAFDIALERTQFWSKKYPVAERFLTRDIRRFRCRVPIAVFETQSNDRNELLCTFNAECQNIDGGFRRVRLSIVIGNDKQISAIVRLRDTLKHFAIVEIGGVFWTRGNETHFGFIDVQTINNQSVDIRDFDHGKCFEMYFKSMTSGESIWQELGEADVYKYKAAPYQFDGRDELLADINEKLDRILRLPLFDGIKESNRPPRLTQIFSNDANYRRVYRGLRELERASNFSFDSRDEAVILERWERLYEYWILAKILEQLIARQGWQYTPDSTARGEDVLRRYLRRNRSGELEGIVIKLHHALPDGERMFLTVHYNRSFDRIFGTNQSLLRPDFVFQVTVNGETKNFVLDAKYRDYHAMDGVRRGVEDGFKNWARRDILGVCVEKYIKQAPRGIEITSAFIVHNDHSKCGTSRFGKYVDFGGSLDEKLNVINRRLTSVFRLRDGVGLNHRCGSFYMAPGCDEDNYSSENLTAWLQLLFEYGFPWSASSRVCWRCGNVHPSIEALRTRRGRMKYYLVCRRCGSFWVRNHCSFEGCGSPLFKHEFNYHTELDGRCWHVVCPRCGGRVPI